MKYLLILICLANFQLFASDWKQVDSIYNQELQSINCPDKKTCYACVNHGVSSIDESAWRLYKSTDFGRTWNLSYKAKGIFQQSKPIIITIREGVSPHPDYYFVASNDYSVIKKSSDGGKSFKKIMLDSSVMGSSAILYSLAMYDTLIGFVTNTENYFITSDGWETFKKYPKLNRYQTYYSPVFINSNTMFVSYCGQQNDSGFAFLKYHLYENKWDTLSFLGFDYDSNYIKRDFQRLYNIYFVNDLIGFGCGSSKAVIEGREYYDMIYKTTDGGFTWKTILKYLKYPEVGLDNNNSFADEKNGIAVGFYGKIAMTNDGGDTWTYEELPNEMDHCRKMQVCWAGRTPLIGTWDKGIFRYEGDFFKFPPDTAKIQVEDSYFGKYDIDRTDTLTKKLKILNDAEEAELKILGYSKLNTDTFSTNLPEVDSLHPIVIQAQESYEYEVYFKPNAVKQYSDSIVFYSNAKKTDNIAYLSGEGIAFTAIQADNQDFKTKEIHDTTATIKKIKIHNLSDYTDLNITGFSQLTESAFTNQFVWLDTMTYITVKPNEYFELPVSFKPTEMRKYKDSIIVFSNASKLDSVILLEGEGIDSSIGVVDNLITNDELLITPNPAEDFIEIRYEFLNHRVNPMVQELEIEIYNVLGECVKKNLTPTLSKGEGVIKIDVSDLVPRVYIVRFGNNVKIFVKE